MPRRDQESLAAGADRESPASVRADDAHAWETLVLSYGDVLRRYAYRYVRSREAAAEIVQDVFLNVWRTREQLLLQDEPLAYLYSATRNRALDVLAYEGVRRRWHEEWCLEQLHPAAPKHAAAPDEEAHLAELVGAIEEALGRMPERRQLVCSMRWKDGLGPREIAARLQLSLKTVETQITRGLRELRIALNGHLEA